MREWFRQLDRILRGDATRPAALRGGDIEVNGPGLAAVLVVLGGLYGFCMGWFALFNRDAPEFRQLPAAMLKVPALFLLTLLVTFPSLYVFNALVGSRLTAPALLRLLIASLGVTLAVLASFGPIVAFFSLTTTNYPFMVLLNVLLFALAGGLGLTFLLQTSHRLTLAGPDRPAEPAAPDAEGPLGSPAGHVFARGVKVVFYCWVVVFALVGGQMSWVLRPFIGTPDQPFQWFRPRQSNFFEAVWRAFQGLFS